MTNPTWCFVIHMHQGQTSQGRQAQHHFCNRVSTMKAEKPSNKPTQNDNPTPNDNVKPTQTPEVANNPIQIPTRMGTQSQLCKATSKQNAKVPKCQAKHHLPSGDLNHCLQCFDCLKSWKKCISVKKKKELDLVDPNHTFRVSKRCPDRVLDFATLPPTGQTVFRFHTK